MKLLEAGIAVLIFQIDHESDLGPSTDVVSCLQSTNLLKCNLRSCVLNLSFQNDKHSERWLQIRKCVLCDAEHTTNPGFPLVAQIVHMLLICECCGPMPKLSEPDSIIQYPVVSMCKAINVR